MAIVLVFLAVLLALLIVGWRARRHRQSDIAAPHPVPADQGKLIGTFTGKYVATTVAGEPFDRIAVHGLGFRGPVAVTAAEAGLAVKITGEDDIWISVGALRGIRRATWTIDRVVETDGLHLIEWTLGDRTVDSYFRIDEPRAFEAAVRSMIERQTA
ncbi:MAG: hypothetical protein ACKVOG_09255 [Rhodoglobus sp.]